MSLEEAAAEARNYFLVRSCLRIPLQDAVVGVGWDDIRFCDFPNAGEIIKDITQVKGWNIGRWGNQVRRFKAIRQGDVVVVPYWGGTIAIGIATGKELHDPKYYGHDGSNQHRIQFPVDTAGKVKLLPRASLSEALQKRLKIRITVADLSGFAQELDTILAKLQSGETYSWSAEIATKEQNLMDSLKKQLLQNIRSGKTSLRSGGIGLEHLVAELLRVDGFEADVLGKRAFKGFGDADIKASKTHRLHTDDFLIQVKHHEGRTGLWGQHQLTEIRKLMADEYADYHLVLVTSGDLGDEETKFARENDITTLDGNSLADWILDALPKLHAETRAALGISQVPQILS